MNFRHVSENDEPEINLVPLIDILLVILIFLAATTTFTRITQLEVDLPRAAADIAPTNMVTIAISRDGIYAIDGRLLSANTTLDIAQALEAARQQYDGPALVINADAMASHESVVRVMEAARLAGIERINFATQSPS